MDVQRPSEETVFRTFSNSAIPTEFGKDDEGSGVDVELASAEMRRAREQAFVSGV